MNDAPLPIDHLDTPADSCRGGVVSIGNFDGIHAGHCCLLARLRHRARMLGVPAIAVSFEPHPFRVLRPEHAPPALTWPERKVELLRAAGADGVVLYRTTPAMLDLSAREFFTQIVLGRLVARGMVEGRDFGFGKGREGNIASLETLCREEGISLDVVEMKQGDGQSVSSTRVRAALAAADLAAAANMLGRPHRIRGTVVHGDHRGRTLGFPTANLADVLGLLPAEGVYACRAWRGGRPIDAAANVGPNPTFGIRERKVEVHLLDFDDDLYGEVLDLDFLAHVRAVQPFKDLDALRARLTLDVTLVRSHCERVPPDPHPEMSELSRTIEEWLRQQIEPALRTLDGHLERATLTSDGTLKVDWRLPPKPLPSDLFEVLMNLEPRVRKVFGEVRHVQASAPRESLSERQ